MDKIADFVAAELASARKAYGHYEGLTDVELLALVISSQRALLMELHELRALNAKQAQKLAMMESRVSRRNGARIDG